MPLLGSTREVREFNTVDVRYDGMIRMGVDVDVRGKQYGFFRRMCETDGASPLVGAGPFGRVGTAHSTYCRNILQTRS